jgi:Zona pellucida-like domain
VSFESIFLNFDTYFLYIVPAPYGLFAYSCYAMAKDSASTFKIIDDSGCPVDTEIFPAFQHVDHALSATYEAFRFTESYGVIFQCNIRYCLGPCPLAECSGERVVVAETTEAPKLEGNELDLERTLSEPERSLHISWGRKRRSIESS